MKKLIFGVVVCIVSLFAITANVAFGMTQDEFDKELIGNMVDKGIKPETARKIFVIAAIRDSLELQGDICTPPSEEIDIQMLTVAATIRQNAAGGKFSSGVADYLKKNYPCK